MCGFSGGLWESQGLQLQNLDFPRQEGEGLTGHVPSMGSSWVVAYDSQPGAVLWTTLNHLLLPDS